MVLIYSLKLPACILVTHADKVVVEGVSVTMSYKVQFCRIQPCCISR